MYDSEDISSLSQMFYEAIEQRKVKKENTGFQSNFMASMGGTSKFGGSRKHSRDEFKPKVDSKLLYQEFLKIILDF